MTSVVSFGIGELRSPPRRKLARAIVAGSLAALALAVYLALMVCHFLNWDKVAVVILFPIWIWSIVWGGISVLAMLLWPHRFILAIIWIWVLTAFFGSDETAGIVKIWRPQLQKEKLTSEGKSTTFRVATMNCEGGSVAIEAIRDWEPDILFLQEAPNRASLEKIAEEFYGAEGSILGGSVCAIVARGKLELHASEFRPRFIDATWTMRDGRQVEVTSLHLSSATTRIDFWNPNARKMHEQIRLKHREELGQIFDQISPRMDRVRILAGDFNAVPRDPLFAGLRRKGYVDAWTAAGRGWGNTFSNRLPLLRIDQIWTTSEIKAQKSRVSASVGSDHRVLLADFAINPS